MVSWQKLAKFRKRSFTLVYFWRVPQYSRNILPTVEIFVYGDMSTVSNVLMYIHNYVQCWALSTVGFSASSAHYFVDTDNRVHC